MDEFAPEKLANGTFIIQNISNDKKTIQIFQVNIPYGARKNLLQIAGVSEANIRSSLLKGILKNKILAQEISIIQCDIYMPQLNPRQKQFLMNAGMTQGLYLEASNTTSVISSAGSSSATINNSSSSPASIFNTVLLSINTNRIKATIFNDSGFFLYIQLGGAASQNNFTIKLLPGSYYEVPKEWAGSVCGVWSGNVGFARVSEMLP